ncbi:MAG: GIY-YIG nuclease family protein [Tissierellia bacterium]|nr:GIY-YIG nuclease family protein [Tissierellia bacterium]
MNSTSENLMKKINRIPALPGVYKMLDSQGRIIYVGKSISLKNRVRSYFTKNHNWKKVEKMVAFIHDIEYITTDTHLEARLLECRLIKEIKPIFNAQFKNHEKYVYLKVEDYNPYNPLAIVNNREENSFGPFRRRSFLINLIDSLKNLYPIIRESKTYTFQYKLMPTSMDKDAFEMNKNTLLSILSNEEEMGLFVGELEKKMHEAASKLEFAAASYYRDLIYGLNYARKRIHEYKSLISKDILLKIPISEGYKLFFISNGRLLLKSTYTSLSQGDMERFIDMGKTLKSSPVDELDEKSSLDFRDILYSEIEALPKEMVITIK